MVGSQFSIGGSYVLNRLSHFEVSPVSFCPHFLSSLSCINECPSIGDGVNM